MSDATKQPTCEERIGAHMTGRIDDFRRLLMFAQDPDEAMQTDEGRTFAHEEFGDMHGNLGTDDLQETALERIHEYPLGVSSQTVFRVDLSTGGPADWLEVFCSGDTPNYEPADGGEYYEVERIVYHFADWFDHAARELDGDDWANAAAFVRQVVPELID